MKNSKVCNFIKKETLAQVFSCEFCKISKNIFLHRAFLVAASEESIVDSKYFSFHLLSDQSVLIYELKNWIYELQRIYFCGKLNLNMLKTSLKIFLLMHQYTLPYQQCIFIFLVLEREPVES